MEYTKNYNLKKPSEEDFYNVNDFNSNSEIVDTELKKLDQIIKILQDGINAAELLKKIKEIDGPGSGLDADTVHGLNTGYSPTNSYIPIVNNSILEIGRTIDFHIQNSTQDFDARMFIDANFLPAWHIPNQTVKRIPLADGTLQTNLNADLLDGKNSTDFLNTPNGNSVVLQSPNVDNLKDSGEFYLLSPTNVPPGISYSYLKVQKADSSHSMQFLYDVYDMTKSYTRLLIGGVWQPWTLRGGSNMFTVPRQFSVSAPTAGQTIFSYSGGPGEVICIQHNGDNNRYPVFFIDGKNIDTPIFPYSWDNTSAARIYEYRIMFKNSVVIKARDTTAGGFYTCNGLVMTEK